MVGTELWQALSRREGASLEELTGLWTSPAARDDIRVWLEALAADGLVRPADGVTVSTAALEPSAVAYERPQLEKYGSLEQLILSGE